VTEWDLTGAYDPPEVNWPPLADDPLEEPHGSHDYDAHSLLPSPDRIRDMSSEDLADLRDRVADWRGDAAERFRQRVAERLAGRGEP
jgi:hypothetical protein